VADKFGYGGEPCIVGVLGSVVGVTTVQVNNIVLLPSVVLVADGLMTDLALQAGCRGVFALAQQHQQYRRTQSSVPPEGSTWNRVSYSQVLSSRAI
jgi:hypothetical protein